MKLLIFLGLMVASTFLAAGNGPYPTPGGGGRGAEGNYTAITNVTLAIDTVYTNTYGSCLLVFNLKAVANGSGDGATLYLNVTNNGIGVAIPFEGRGTVSGEHWAQSATVPLGTNATFLFHPPSAGDVVSISGAFYSGGASGSGGGSGDYATVSGSTSNAVSGSPLDVQLTGLNPVKTRFVVRNSGRLPDTQNPTSKAAGQSRDYIAACNITNLSISFPNYYGNSETGNGGTAGISAAVEYPIGTYCGQFLWGGATRGSIPSGTSLMSDVLTLTNPILNGARFRIRQYYTNSAGIYYRNYGSTIGFVTSEFGAVVDQTVGTNIIGGAGPNAYDAMAIVGSNPFKSVMIIGDSRDAGLADVTSGLFYGMDKIVGRYYGIGNMSIGAASTEDTFTDRFKYRQYADIVLTDFGFNGISSTSAARMSAFAANFSVPVWAETVMPATTSSDNWATLSGQTVDPALATFQLYNNTLRSNLVANIAGYVDVANVLQSSLGSGKWAVNGVANWITVDGTHGPYYDYLASYIGDPFSTVPSLPIGTNASPIFYNVTATGVITGRLSATNLIDTVADARLSPNVVTNNATYGIRFTNGSAVGGVGLTNRELFVSTIHLDVNGGVSEPLIYGFIGDFAALRGLKGLQLQGPMGATAIGIKIDWKNCAAFITPTSISNLLVSANSVAFDGSIAATNGVATYLTNVITFTSSSLVTNMLNADGAASLSAGTSVTLKDRNGNTIDTIGTIATLHVLVPMRVGMILSGTAMTGVIY